MELYYSTYPAFPLSRQFPRLVRRIVRRLVMLLSELPDAFVMVAVSGNAPKESRLRNSSTRRNDMEIEEMTRIYRQLVNRICLSYSDCREDFEDMRQDVWINIWKGLDSFRKDASIDTWIYRVTLNTCVSCLRKRKRRVPTSPIDEIFPEPADDDGQDLFRERLRLIHRLISCLSPMDKAIVTMHLDERSNSEIAEVTGLSIGNVATRLSRIRSRLSTEIQKYYKI